jgi:hypothetical protein
MSGSKDGLGRVLGLLLRQKTGRWARQDSTAKPAGEDQPPAARDSTLLERWQPNRPRSGRSGPLRLMQCGRFRTSRTTRHRCCPAEGVTHAQRQEDSSTSAAGPLVGLAAQALRAVRQRGEGLLPEACRASQEMVGQEAADDKAGSGTVDLETQLRSSRRLRSCGCLSWAQLRRYVCISGASLVAPVVAGRLAIKDSTRAWLASLSNLAWRAILSARLFSRRPLTGWLASWRLHWRQAARVGKSARFG